MCVTQLSGPGAMWKLACVLGLLMLPAVSVEAWYKQATNPRYHTVGRASGLLLGVRRSPYARRRGVDDEDHPLNNMDNGGDPHSYVDVLRYQLLTELLGAPTRESLHEHEDPKVKLLDNSPWLGQADDGLLGPRPDKRALPKKRCPSQMRATEGDEGDGYEGSRLQKNVLVEERAVEVAHRAEDSNDMSTEAVQTKCAENKSTGESTHLQIKGTTLQRLINFLNIWRSQRTENMNNEV